MAHSLRKFCFVAMSILYNAFNHFKKIEMLVITNDFYTSLMVNEVITIIYFIV